MGLFAISIPIGGAGPNFSMDPQIMVLMKHNKFRFDWSMFGRDYSHRINFGSNFVVHNLITFEQRWIQKNQFGPFCTA